MKKVNMTKPYILFCLQTQTTVHRLFSFAQSLEQLQKQHGQSGAIILFL